MSKLTVSQLQAFVASRGHTEPAKALIDLAESILVTNLGAEWVERNVRNAGPRDYFRVEGRESLDGYRHHHRFIELAEMLFNLQHHDGFSERLDALRDGDTEAGVAEFAVGRFLVLCGLDFSFCDRTGQKGADYDVSVRLPDGTEMPGEAKCKVEGTEYSESTLRNSLGDARRQLPTNRPGFVFLKLLEEWFLGDETIEALEAALGGFLRNTGRVAAVVLMWERWMTNEGGARVSGRYDLRMNPSPRQPVAGLEEALTPRLPRPEWLELPTVVGL